MDASSSFSNHFVFPPAKARLGSRALVLGASLAGLLTARALSDCFDEVWLVERDVLPEGPQLRKGTPHTGHAHGLLARGRMVMEAMFPGLTDELVAQGASVGDLGQEGAFIAGTHRFVQTETGLIGMGVSRLRLEAAVRRRVLALPGVAARDGVDVLGLSMGEDRATVTGVRVVRRDHEGRPGPEQTWHADLVIDATGRGSRMPQWLAQHGFDAPEEERAGASANYATAYFERQAGDLPVRVAIKAPAPPLPMGGALIAQEPESPGAPERWVMTLGSFGKDKPVATLEGMLERAQALGCPEMLHVLRHCKPIGTVARYQFPHSQRRHYERLKRFPQRLLVLGDAMTSFNPVYGQGMSTAANQMLELREALALGLDAKLSQRFFKAAARVVDIPWQTAVGTDLAFEVVPGERTRMTRFINGYVARVHAAAAHDAEVAKAFLKVAHLMARPPSLMAPNVLVRVLWQMVRGKAKAKAPGVAGGLAGASVR